MPWMSSGVVSLRMRMTGDLADMMTASSEVKADCGRTAAPGEASMPLVASLKLLPRSLRIESRGEQLVERLGVDAQTPPSA